MQRADNIHVVILFRSADEQNLAICRIRYRFEIPELKTPVVHLPITDGFLQVVAENILPQYPDDDGGIGAGKRSCGPLDKLREVEQKRRFDFILSVLFLC